MATLPTGIRRTGSGWQVYTKRGGTWRSKHFPPETPIAELRKQRDLLRARATLGQDEPADTDGTLCRDAELYLHDVRNLITFKDRKHRIDAWVDALGRDTKRTDITTADIRRVLERWRTQGLKPGTLNLRRSALAHVWTILDGKSAPNPVREIDRYREIPPALVLPTIAEVESVLSTMQASKNQARLRVLLWTGWPPSQVKRLEPNDLNLPKKAARVPPRRKGAGVEARWLPLLPQAVKALKNFQAVDGWGNFSLRSMRHRLHAACDRAGVARFRIYDLRHLFLTTIASIAKDDRVVSELAQHSTLEQARRYTEQSVSPRLRDAVALVTKRLQPLQPSRATTGNVRQRRSKRNARNTARTR